MNEEQQQQEPQTPEQIALRMEELRVEKLELEQKARREQKQREKLAEERREMLFTDELRREIAGVGVGDFQLSDGEIQQVLQHKYKAKFLIRDTGEFAVEVEGRPVEFSKLVEKLAIDTPTLLHDRSTIAHLVKAKHELSREDFPTTAAKSRFIQENGLSAWENMNSTRQELLTKQSVTREAYLKMSNRQKIALGLSEDEVSRLLRHGKI